MAGRPLFSFLFLKIYFIDYAITVVPIFLPMSLSACYPPSLQQEVFKVMKSKDLQPRLLYPAKLSFRMEGQIKCFPDKVKLKEFIITKASLFF